MQHDTFIEQQLAVITGELRLAVDLLSTSTDTQALGHAMATIRHAAYSVLRVTGELNNACAKITTRVNSAELHQDYDDDLAWIRELTAPQRRLTIVRSPHPDTPAEVQAAFEDHLDERNERGE